MGKKNVKAEEIESHLLQKLREHAANQGVTYSVLCSKCGVAWRRAVAKRFKLGKQEGRAQQTKDLVYELWRKGLVFVEPPRGLQGSPRVWDVESAHSKFGAALKPVAIEAKDLSESALERFRAEYERLAARNLGGYLPVFELRRALKWSPEEFDRVLKNLNQRRKPLIELHGGDPQNYSEDQKRDSYFEGDRLYLLIRWRKS